MTSPAAPASMEAAGEGWWPRARVRIALLLVLLYAGASTVEWLERGTAGSRRSAPDEISVYERRFRDLRAALPARGLVGYLGDPELAHATSREANAAALLRFRRYLLAQYTLAPLLLVQSTRPEFVIGNFSDPAARPAPAGFQVVRDFGDGVVLYRRVRA